MRSHSSEHRDSLPFLDVTALRHIAYVLDGIVFYMRSAKESDFDKIDSLWLDQVTIPNHYFKIKISYYSINNNNVVLLYIG